MGSFVRDLQHGVRQLLRRPGFSAAAIASLALGIGLNTTLFSVVNAVLLRDSADRATRPARRDLHGLERRTSHSSPPRTRTTSTSGAARAR